MKHLTVRVTQDHIDKGVATSCRECPIALAVSELGYRDVTVNGFFVLATKGLEQHYAWRTSSSAGDFMYKFDNGRKVSPINFRFRPHYAAPSWVK